MPEIKNQLVLYTSVICPFAQRAHLVLNAKKIPYQTVYLDLFSKAEWYVQRNPTGKVPALEIPGETDPIIESLLVADYLDEKYPNNPLYPKDAYLKVKDRVLVDRFTKVADIVAKIMYPMLRNHKRIENVDEVADELFRALDVYETELKKRGSQYFGGDKPGMLDYMIWPYHERMMFLPKIDSRYSLDNDRFKSIVSRLHTLNFNRLLTKLISRSPGVT